MKPLSLRTSLWSKKGLSALLFSICVLWFLSWGAAKLLIVSAPLEHADVIVVLSGSSAFVERSQLAAELFSAGHAEKIVLTNDNRQGGWLSAQQRNPYFYERARWELQRHGVPAAKIEVIGPPVNGTWDEALAVRKFAEVNGVTSILIVTSAYHSRRALWTFRHVLGDSGVTVGLVPVSPGWQTPRPATWWLCPRGWQTVPVEYLKMIYYHVR